MLNHEVKLATVARYVRTSLTRIHNELQRPLPAHERAALKAERRVLEPLAELLLQDMREPIQARRAS